MYDERLSEMWRRTGCGEVRKRNREKGGTGVHRAREIERGKGGKRADSLFM